MESVLHTRPALKKELDRAAEVAGYLWQRGWAERNGGNLTIRITEHADDGLRALPALGAPQPIGIRLPNLKGCWFYCKGTGKRMRDLARDPMSAGSIIRITEDCAHYEIVADSPVMPTSELPSHLSLQDYLIGSGSHYKATLHTHPIELVALTHGRKWLEKDAVELASATLEMIKHYDVVLWEKHGTVAVGPDIMEAFDQTDVLNKAAILYKTAKQFGFTPEGLTPEAVGEIRDVFHLPSERHG